MQLADFMDPLAPPDLAAGGAEEDEEMRELLVSLATSARSHTVFKREDMVHRARQLGLLEQLVGLLDSGDMDLASCKRFGRQIQKWRGREMRDRSNPPRAFRFGHRRQKTGATYPLTFL